ncbi:MAG: hypothetical protein GY820_29690 [Gammaproteobacteria bacterium]|nr:hypothetical protein [Gammaproteobacteria bacterium]
MESFKKMALVPADFAISERHTPIKSQLSLLDMEMKKILESSEADDVKFKRYNHALHQHGSLGKEMKRPQRVEFKVEKRKKLGFSVPRDRLLRNIPYSKQEPARLLIEHLEQSQIPFTDKNELVIDGKAIIGSNLMDLFDHASRDRCRNAPKGWNEFKNVLRETNVPASAIGNRNFGDYENDDDDDDDDNFHDVSNVMQVGQGKVKCEKRKKPKWENLYK